MNDGRSCTTPCPAWAETIKRLEFKLDRYEKGDTKQWILDELKLRRQISNQVHSINSQTEEILTLRSRLDTLQSKFTAGGNLYAIECDRANELERRLDAIKKIIDSPNRGDEVSWKLDAELRKVTEIDDLFSQWASGVERQS